MKKYIVVFLAVVLALGVLWACVPAMPEGSGDAGSTGIKEYSSNRISRYIDDEAGVVCYIYNGEAISCLPKDLTNLR